MSKEHLTKHCVDLQALLTDRQTDEADIDGLQTMEELDALSVLVKTKAPPLEVLQFITKYDFAHNVAYSFDITNVSGIRGKEFLLIKLIKTA
jgi:hypothetical protein